MRRLGFYGVGLLGLIAATNAFADERSSEVTITWGNGSQQASWKLAVEAKGSSVATLQREAIAKLFAFYDQDGNGLLEGNEAETIVSPFGLRQMPLGRMLPSAIQPPARVDVDSDGKLSQAEFAAYYATSAHAGLWLACDQVPRTDALNEALCRALQLASGEVVDETKVTNAAKALSKLDANGDELISPGEILTGHIYPGITPTRLIPSTETEVKPLADLTVRSAAFSGKSNDGDWLVHFLPDGTKLTDRSNADESSAAKSLASRSPQVWVRLHAAPLDGTKAENALVALASQFTSTAGADDQVPAKEVAGIQNQINMQNLVRLADANRDEVLTRAEFEAWQEVARAYARSVFVVTILDFERNLFTALDENFDGSLSTSELADAWPCFQAAGIIVDGRLVIDRLPKQLRIVVSQGPCQQLTDPGQTQGPTWFQALDRNGDGQISAAEFPGTADKFARLDRDGDGVISLDDL
ncbi:EF-hand domain-containing protein [Bremerella sp. JC817]|uniref:EF-hand domain-containing protein n=1 Tax=Bremerella sp. JC817 TaxID=3231756 RepID=UPI00345A7BFD